MPIYLFKLFLRDTTEYTHLSYLSVLFLSFYFYPLCYYIFRLSSFLLANSVFIIFFLCICFAFFFNELTLLSLTVTFVLHHLYLLFYMYSFPICSLLYFLMCSDTVVNRFIVDRGRPRSRNFNSIASYVREMMYAMHSRSHVHARSTM